MHNGSVHQLFLQLLPPPPPPVSPLPLPPPVPLSPFPSRGKFTLLIKERPVPFWESALHSDSCLLLSAVLGYTLVELKMNEQRGGLPSPWIAQVCRQSQQGSRLKRRRRFEGPA
ncbi:hypothetical protein ACOMHN_050964 [Nucella lapillus]